MKGSMNTVNEQLQNIRFSRDKLLKEITVLVELDDNINTLIDVSLSIQDIKCIK